ncbi:MAG: tRNA dihydrouridine synthase DusB [Rhodospirillaceae bacterium]|nr:tRNA dihydrouridine synthase DusB [Rhodospirillaceae bacterium]MBT4045662.1 tRNA dihydrouridine synthase DusB [Rhodospirillaceae bacterium]MBT4687391.1 tRNA dihydrouridine synthase DusB [Rhodospirillaceae bacterium]MBT5079081.1 tRNA dihydrouridine synthase DusB [Rhodospirillaceae bacterium]MBT5526344.1 tRNA dihydrouridine synthase DusB [Rhodospirillaceae bacterium]
MHLGSATYETPVFLAPMSGITDQPFRRVVCQYGVDVVVSEMIASAGVVDDHRLSRERAMWSGEEGLRVVQLAGCRADIMARAAAMNQDDGADVIDINMGCPVKKVVGGSAGSALMRDEELALSLIRAVVDAVDIPVTLKMRTGWDLDQRNAPTLAARAEAAGVAMITVHGRTRCQFYDGHADWDFIAQVKDAVDIPVIANGDVIDPDDGKTMLAQSGADGVMIGRGAFGRPWFPAQVRHYLATGERLPDPGLTQQRDTVLAHYQAILDHYGPGRGLRIARKHINRYLERLGVAREDRRGVLRLGDSSAVVDRITELYDLAISSKAA